MLANIAIVNHGIAVRMGRDMSGFFRHRSTRPHYLCSQVKHGGARMAVGVCGKVVMLEIVCKLIPHSFSDAPRKSAQIMEAPLTID